MEARTVVGHWEIDTVKGDDQARHAVVTLVERKTGYLEVGKLARHTAAEATRRTTQLIARHPRRVRTVTAACYQVLVNHALRGLRWPLCVQSS